MLGRCSSFFRQGNASKLARKVSSSVMEGLESLKEVAASHPGVKIAGAVMISGTEGVVLKEVMGDSTSFYESGGGL